MVPIVPLVMAAASIGKGIADQSKAKNQKRDAQRLQDGIPRQDPGVLSLLHDIQARTGYAETGQSKMMGYKRRMAENANAQYQVNNTRTAGTAPGTVQQGALRGLNTTQQALMRGAAETEQLSPQYMAMQGPLVSDMADRSLSLSTYGRDAMAFEAAQTQTNANNLLLGGFGLASSLNFGTEALASNGGSAYPGGPKEAAAGSPMPWDYLQPKSGAFTPDQPLLT